jgi:hypothetical protein
MTKFDVIDRRLPGRTEERNEKSQCGKAVSRRKFEMVISQAVFARSSVTIAANLFDGVTFCFYKMLFNCRLTN